jgi:hypothetical protein
MSTKIHTHPRAGACERCPNTCSHAIRRAIRRLRLPVPAHRASASVVAIATACRRVTSASSSRRFLCNSLRRTVSRIATACRRVGSVACIYRCYNPLHEIDGAKNLPGTSSDSSRRPRRFPAPDHPQDPCAGSAANEPAANLIRAEGHKLSLGFTILP